MKKILLICCILSFIMLFGCTNNGSTVDEPTKDSTSMDTLVYTDVDLVSNSSTDYVILLPSTATSEEKIAADELYVFFFEATGIKLNIVEEKDYTSGKFISVGKTDQLKINGIVLNIRKKELLFHQNLLISNLLHLYQVYINYHHNIYN